MTDLKTYQQRGAFFTRFEVAERTWAIAMAHAKRRGLRDLLWVEPSAGAGAFIKAAPDNIRLACYDIQPMHSQVDNVRITKRDFLTLKRLERPFALVGNPPWGRQGAMAAQFINHAFALGAEFACLITPGVMAGYHGQRRVDETIGICGEPEFVDGNTSFLLPDGRKYSVGHARTILWELAGARSEKPRSEHPAFYVRQAAPNRESSLKYAASLVNDDGWAVGVHSITGKFVTGGTPLSFFKQHGGYWNLFFPKTISSTELDERVRSINWDAVSNGARLAGNPNGIVSPHRAYAAYAERYGWGDGGND